MSNDSVGIICNAHLVHAYLSPRGALDEKCLELAKQAALSFDFPKTGVPGRMPPHLRVTKYPDFMEKEEGKETYRSSQILGSLFRVVKRKVTERVEKEGPLIEAPTDRESSRFWWPSEEQARDAFDPDLVVEGYEKYVEEAWEMKRKWDVENLNLMHYVRRVGSGGVGEWGVVCGSHVDNVDHLFFFGDRASTPCIDLLTQYTQNLHIPVEIRTEVEYVMKKSSCKGRIGETMEVQE